MKKSNLLACLAGLGALLAVTLAVHASTADHAREKKWADEVVPGLVIGDPVFLQMPRGQHKFLTLFTPAPGSQRAVIVVHGMGIHPDWGMVGTLRIDLADRGYTTLSIQMPILAADARAEAYPPTFPEAVERLGVALDFLKARGYARIAIVSHSMGSRMSLEYLRGKPDPAVVAWASLGPSFKTYEAVKLPVLDLYGDNDLPAVLGHAATRQQSFVSPMSKQVKLVSADHFFTGREAQMVEAVDNFLKQTLK